MRPFATSLLFGLLALAPNSWGAEASLTGLQAKGTQFEGRLEVLNTPTGLLSANVQVSGESRPIRVGLDPHPVDLWILLDTSRLCALERMDVYLTTLFSQLPRALHSRSTLTFGSFTAGTRDLIAQKVSMADAATLKVACEPKHLSGSYEDALARLFETASPSEFPTKVWVFTSGNIALTEKFQKKLRDKGISISLFLYNARIEAEIKGMVEAQRLAVGADTLRYALLNREEGSLPARYFELSGAIPNDLLGKTLALRVNVQANGKDIASTSARLSTSGKKGFPWGLVVFIILVLSAVIFLTYRATRYYRPHHCGKCRRRMRFEDSHCLFCPNEGDAFLLRAGSNSVASNAYGASSVLFLADTITELGTHRKSRFAFSRSPMGRRQCFFKVIREQVGIQRWAYKLVRISDSREVDIQLNGQPLLRNRYLASGDEITVENLNFTFYMKRKGGHEPITA